MTSAGGLGLLPPPRRSRRPRYCFPREPFGVNLVMDPLGMSKDASDEDRSEDAPHGVPGGDKCDGDECPPGHGYVRQRTGGWAPSGDPAARLPGRVFLAPSPSAILRLSRFAGETQWMPTLPDASWRSKPQCFISLSSCPATTHGSTLAGSSPTTSRTRIGAGLPIMIIRPVRLLWSGWEDCSTLGSLSGPCLTPLDAEGIGQQFDVRPTLAVDQIDDLANPRFLFGSEYRHAAVFRSLSRRSSTSVIADRLRMVAPIG